MNLVVALLLLGVATLTVVYPYVIYPLVLWALQPRGRKRAEARWDGDWPEVTITLAAHNEGSVIAGTIERLLELDYPKERLRIIVASDASTDGTDDIVRSYADRGVRLVRLPTRGGKTAAENAVRPHLQGTIVVNTDASVQLRPSSLKPLVAAFQDPSVGVASGRNVIVARAEDESVAGESTYTDYEMWVRKLEGNLGGIVGAAGCFYASRIQLHKELVPEALSRDFAAPLVAWDHGFRAVWVPEAICLVPRASSLRQEYRRKVRTMSRGLQTLFYKRHLLNPLRHGVFAWKLFSHKLARWLVPWGALAGAAGLLALAWSHSPLAWLAVAVLLLGGVAALAGWVRPVGLPKALSLPAYIVLGLLAGLHAWLVVFRGDYTPMWEPTRRGLDGGPAGPS